MGVLAFKVVLNILIDNSKTTNFIFCSPTRQTGFYLVRYAVGRAGTGARNIFVGWLVSNENDEGHLQLAKSPHERHIV
jgi:hypothetical protein